MEFHFLIEQGFVPDFERWSAQGLRDVQEEVVEGLAIDFYEGHDKAEGEDRQPRDGEERKIKNLEEEEDHTEIYQYDHKLSHRDRSKNFVFNINELWDNEAFWHGLIIAN